MKALRAGIERRMKMSRYGYRDRVLLHQRDIGKSKRGVTGEFPLLVFAWRHHRCAAVDKEQHCKILFLLKAFYVETIAACIEAPIDVARIVAELVLAIVRELDAVTAFERKVPALPGAEIIP